MVTYTPVLGRAFPAKPGFRSVGASFVALAITTVFALDWFTPLGIAVHFFYILILWVALAWATPGQAFAVTAAGSALTVIGLFLSPGDELRMGLTNGAITLVALWFLAYFGMTYRKAVDTLCKRERELTDFVENAPVGIHWVAPDGTILWVNQEELDMLGYGREEYVGRCVVEFHVDREVAEDIIEKLNANVPLKNRAARLRHKDGSIRHALISCSVWEDGRFIHSRCFTQDITDRMRAELAESESEQLAAANARLVEETAERSKAEQALSERAELLRVTFDSAPAGINMTTLDGTFIKANTAYQRMVGYSEEELRQMTPGGLTHEGDHPYNQALRAELIAGERDFFELEKRYHLRDGSVIWVRNRVSAVRDDLGKPRFLVAIVQDITERKLAERALQQSQKMYEALVNSVDGIVWEADAQTFRFTFVSKQAEKLLGYPVEQWLDELTFWRNHVHPDDQKWVVDFCVTATREKRAHDFEYRMLAADGRTIWVRDIVSVSVEHDQSVRLRGIIVDITKRKLAEKALQESEERFALFMQHLPNAAVFIKDVEGRYVYANPVTERAMRTQAGGWRGRTDDDLYPPAAAQQFKASDCQALSTLKTVEAVETLCHGDEIQHWLVSKFPIPGNTSPSPLLGGIAIDITTIKRAEEALVASQQRLHQLIEERERLSRNLHDNIIQSIYGIGMQLETCQRQLHDHPKDVAVHLVETIGSLNDVIREVRRYISNPEPQIAGEILLHAGLDRLMQSVGATGAVRFRMKLDPAAVARLTPQQAEHVLHIAREASSNALRHAHARRIRLVLKDEDNGIHFEISDDGVGFDPQAARQHGEGLRNMEFRARQTGGLFEILSTPGDGATVILRIPKERLADDARR
jgi:PAS domain S-box-containing protein